MDSKGHKTTTGIRNSSSYNQESASRDGVNSGTSHKSNKSNLFYTSSGISDEGIGSKSTSKGVKSDKCDVGDNSYEIWCICRVIKPCRECRTQRERQDRDVTLTPQSGSSTGSQNLTDQDSNSSTLTPDESDNTLDIAEDVTDKLDGSCDKDADTQCCVKSVSNYKNGSYPSDLNIVNNTCSGKLYEKIHTGNNSIESICVSDKHNKSVRNESYKDSAKAQLDVHTDNSVGIKQLHNTDRDTDKEVSEIQETAVNDLQDLLAKLEELSSIEGSCSNGDVEGDANNYKSLDFVPNMDSSSVCSFDHFDFDTSFCSLKSSDTMMDQGDLVDQLSLVQQMVVEMKTGFSTAMEELSKIQYGDQTLQQQLADNKNQCAEEIDSVKQALIDLKTEVQRLSGQMAEVNEIQKGLQEKVDAYQSDKTILLDELERNGAITDQIRTRLSGTVPENNNNNNEDGDADLTDVAPMVHPYLNSIQNHHANRDDQYNSDSSLTAAVSRSLNLTQALGEKCLQLDISSSSSDEESNSRHSHSGTGRKLSKRKASFQDSSKGGKKLPPHEHILDQVQREEAARDIVEAEREYCSQIWSLLEDYLNPLRDEDIVNRREINNMFPTYIPHMYEQHCIMLRKMEERVKKWKFTSVLGDMFARFTESHDDGGLNLYKDYISDFPTVINTMNKWFNHSPHFRELMQSQSLANSPVLSALLAPLQQVPKYSLLLKNLLKYTPLEHPDRYYLESSLTRLKSFLNTMNSDLEQAMQTININSQPITRSRDSARSRSSGSSAENNHMSRDSGVHSNEEERAKSPMSPNTTRRFVLQVLREKREQENRPSRGKADLRPPSPHGRFGSHPDLSTQYNGLPDGRISPHLSSLPQSKMFSSLSKLPLPKEKGKRSKSSRLHDSPRPVINTNYLRPLTPQLFPQSTSAYNFEAARRRDDYSERSRHRPSSAMDFTTNSSDNRDQFLELMANQAGLTFSPSHSTSSDHSRRELELSLQKLLLETNNANARYADDMVQEEDNEAQDTYQKQFLATKERILKQGSDGGESNFQGHPQGQQGQGSLPRVKRRLPFNPSTEQYNTQEDYGIYGDDDDDDDDNDDQYEEDKVKPMKLLPDTHRPKIMVPRWRQNASPQPPSYTHSVEQITKPQNSFTSEENLAVSLAQSLLDSEKNKLPVRDNSQKVSNQTSHTSRNTNSLKRKDPSENAQSPKQPPGRQSPSRDIANSVPHGRSQSFDVSAHRPTDLNLTHSHSVSQASIAEVSASRDTMTSVSKLTDVIAYTADCLEKNENVCVTNTEGNGNEIANRNRPIKSLPPTPRSNSQGHRLDSQGQIYSSLNMTEMDGGNTRLSDILSDNSLKVSSVDDSHDAYPLPVTSMNKPVQNVPAFSFAVSPNHPDSQLNQNTEGLVQYFKTRDQINNTPEIYPIKDQTSKVPTFIQKEKTSTPVSEQRSFSPSKGLGKHPAMFQKREIGRPVREDFDQTAKTMNNDGNANGVENFNGSSDSQVGQATKERVLKKVDKLRLSFERQKQLSEERRQQSMLQSPTKELKSPTTQAPLIQRQFNEISMTSRKSNDTSPSPTSGKPLVLKTFSMPNTNSHDISGDQSDSHDNSFSDSSDNKQGIYRKAAQLRTPSRYPTDASSGTKLKLERAISPNGRTPSPTKFTNQYDKFKNQVESSNLRGQNSRMLINHRSLNDSSLIPQRSRSPTRSSAERERPKSTTDLEKITAAERVAEENEHSQLKSALKDTNTKIPVLKKSSPGISKSTEDISKMKKKSAFKTKLNNIFGRKKKKSKLYSTEYYDPEHEYNNYVLEVPHEPAFLQTDDIFNFPLTLERRSNSTSQILQSYHFESDSDSENEISAV